MKRTITSCLFPLILAATLTSTSCIFDSPQVDEFHRTVWKSDKVPLGPFQVSTLTLEFYCNDGVSIRLDEDFIISGTYRSDGGTAIFTDLDVLFENDGKIRDSGAESTPDDDGKDVGQNQEMTVTFIEAHRDGDTLFLLWRVENAVYPFTTALQMVTEQ